MTVHFGSLLASYNLTTTVNQDGTFSVTIYLPNGIGPGSVSAYCYDSQGVESNVAMDTV